MNTADLLWPLPRLGHALQVLAEHLGQPSQASSTAVQLGPPADLQQLPGWLTWASGQLGVQADPVQCAVPATAALLRDAGPSLILVATAQGLQGLVLLGRRGQHLRVLDPQQRPQLCRIDELRALLCAPFEAPLQAEVQALVAEAGVSARHQARTQQAVLDERLAGETLHGVWLLRLPAGAPLRQQLRHARIPQRVLGMLALFALLYGLELGGWRLIGQAALDGRLDTGWLCAWVLLLLSLVPLGLGAAALNAGIALDVGLGLRQRLLAGSLKLDLDTLRHQGSGQLLARVIESQALESAGLAGALGVAVALLELSCAAWVLAQGAAGAWHAGLLGGFVLALAALFARYHRRLVHWTAQRLDMTDQLVERMVGHRTRLAQEPPDRRAAEEDLALHGYAQASRALDTALLPVVAALPALWIWLGLASLAPALVQGGTPGALAISLGGLLFAHRALGSLSGALSALARAAVAWRQAAPLLQAANRSVPPGRYLDTLDTPASSALLEATGLHLQYGERAVLQGAQLRLGPQDRVLLAGASGSGKSSLAALLVGLRQPRAGLLLLQGLDRPTWGDQWHRRATEAPQFHDNHIFSGTLAFNLLMGREWPARPELLAEAEALCHELGLGPLLARMPAGLHQRVGATGWQLSHGERSRVFLARALLQRAPLTVLDESFAALDPETLHQALQCALKRTQALIVIAHP